MNAVSREYQHKYGDHLWRLKKIITYLREIIFGWQHFYFHSLLKCLFYLPETEGTMVVSKQCYHNRWCTYTHEMYHGIVDLCVRTMCEGSIHIIHKINFAIVERRQPGTSYVLFYYIGALITNKSKWDEIPHDLICSYNVSHFMINGCSCDCVIIC